jgi:hypothetical protein
LFELAYLLGIFDGFSMFFCLKIMKSSIEGYTLIKYFAISDCTVPNITRSR